MRRILGLLRLFALTTALLFIALAMIYVALAAWAVWEREIGASGAMLVLSALTGSFGLRLLDELRGGTRRRPCLARADRLIRALPRARVVSR